MPSSQARLIVVDPNAPAADVVDEAVRLLEAGELVIVPTETVYGLAGDPLAPGAVERIYALKGREAGKPLPLLAADREQVRAFGARLDGRALRLAARYWPGPLTLVLETPGGEEGFRVPDHAVMRAILARLGRPLRVTSANRSGAPEARTAVGALAALGAGVALAMDAGPSRLGQASAVVRLTRGGLEILRAGPIDEAELRRVAGEAAA